MNQRDRKGKITFGDEISPTLPPDFPSELIPGKVRRRALWRVASGTVTLLAVYERFDGMQCTIRQISRVSE